MNRAKQAPHVLADRAARRATTFDAKCKAAPTSFFIKHGGRTLKNPHYVPASKRQSHGDIRSKKAARRS